VSAACLPSGRARGWRRGWLGPLALVTLLVAPACAHRRPPVTKIVGGEVIVTRSVDPNAYEHVSRALLFEGEGRLEEARDELRRALNYDRDAPEIHAHLAELLVRLDELDGAEGALGESMRLGETVDALLGRAHLLQARGRAAASVEPLARAAALVDLRRAPAEAERVHLELAEAQILALDLDAAAATLARLCELLPTSTSARVRLAAVAWARGTLDVAERRLGEALALEPNQIDALLTLAWIQTAEGRNAEARASFRQALDRAEGSLEVGAAFARFLMATGAAADAVDLVDDLVAAQGGDDALGGRIELERVVKRHDRALALLAGRIAATTAPEARARLELGRAELLEDQGRKDEALLVLRAIPAEAAVAGVARLRAAALLRDLGRTAEAWPLLAEAAKGDAEELRRDVAIARALTHEKAGELAAGLKVLDEALADAAQDVRLTVTRAALIERHGRWQEALAQVERLLDKGLGGAEALNFWGFVAVDHGHEIERGKRRIRAALALEPGSGAIIDSLGWAHFRLGELEPAARFLEQAGRLEPEDPEILGHLAELYARLGEQARARATLDRALLRKPEEPLRSRLEELRKRLGAAEASK
jgi:Tfp pilus assembly protein PilF